MHRSPDCRFGLKHPDAHRTVAVGTQSEAKRTALVYTEIGAILQLTIVIGEIVGSYRIERELGIGGMGTVFLAKHTILDKWAAVKMLRPKYSNDPEAIDRFFTEATATTAVRHGGIVDVYDFGHHSSGSAYLVMELLEGETLGEKIRREERLSERQALGFGWQAVRALAAAHAAGIVHRDLKPDNIFLSDDQAAVGGVRVKLLDFGIAKLRTPGARSHTTPGELIGTPLFMSPEHCLGKDLDGRADVYSIACVIFYAISGRPPFCSEDFGVLLRSHAEAQPPHLTEVFDSARPEVSDLLFRCLRKDPERRPDAREFAEALRTLSDAPLEVTVPPAEPTVAPSVAASSPSPQVPTQPTPSSRVPTRLLLVAALFLLGGLGMALLLRTAPAASPNVDATKTVIIEREVPVPAPAPPDETPTRREVPGKAADAMLGAGVVPQQSDVISQPGVALVAAEREKTVLKPKKTKSNSKPSKKDPDTSEPSKEEGKEEGDRGETKEPAKKDWGKLKGY